MYRTLLNYVNSLLLKILVISSIILPITLFPMSWGILSSFLFSKEINWFSILKCKALLILIILIIFFVLGLTLIISFVLDFMYAFLCKKVLNLNSLWLYPTNKLILKALLYLLLEKDIRNNIYLPNNYIYIEPHYIAKNLKSLQNFKTKRNTYNDIKNLLEKFPDVNVIFFAYTPMKLEEVLTSRHFSIPKNIHLIGPFPAKTFPQTDKPSRFVYFIKKTVG